MLFNLSLLADDDDAADEHADAMRTMREGMATPAMEWNEFGVIYATASWRRGRPSRSPAGCSTSSTPRRTTFGRTPLLHVLAIAGLEQELRTELDRAPLRPLTDNWYLTSEASVRAVIAGFLGDEALARRSVEHLRPLSGRMAVVRHLHRLRPDRRLPGHRPRRARRAHRGERFAERAEALATRWGMTAYLRWFAGERARLAF